MASALSAHYDSGIQGSDSGLDSHLASKLRLPCLNKNGLDKHEFLIWPSLHCKKKTTKLKNKKTSFTFTFSRRFYPKRIHFFQYVYMHIYILCNVNNPRIKFILLLIAHFILFLSINLVSKAQHLVRFLLNNNNNINNNLAIKWGKVSKFYIYSLKTSVNILGSFPSQVNWSF